MNSTKQVLSNGYIKSSQLVSWLEELDWICCIRCCSRPYESKNNFFVTDCGHIYCNSCKEIVTKCTKCQRTGMKFLTIAEDVKGHPLIGEFFHDPLELLKKTVKMLEFQQAHIRRDQLHQRQMGEPTVSDLRNKYGELAELSSRELQAVFNKKMAYCNQEEHKLKVVTGQLKKLFDEIVVLVRHMKQLGWNEQALTVPEGNGHFINGVELLHFVAAMLTGITRDGRMENHRMTSSRNGIVTPIPPNTTPRSLSSTNGSGTTSYENRRPLVAPPPPPPPFPPHLKMMCSQQQMETQNTGTSPMSWQPSMSRGMPPPRLPPSRKLAPPNRSIVNTPSNQPGISMPPAMSSRHQQQTTPSSVGRVSAPHTPLDCCTPMDCSSSHFSARNKLPTPDSTRGISPSPSQTAILRVTPTHSQLNRSRPHSAGVKSASPSPFTTPQNAPSSLKRISIRGPPSGGKIGTTPTGNLTPDSSLHKMLQDKRRTPHSQSPSTQRSSVIHTSGGSGGGGGRSQHYHHHPNSTSSSSNSRTLQRGRKNMMVVSRRPGT